MGSAEFEFGALGACLKIMRSNPLLPEPKRIKVAGEHTCWYVGREEEYEKAKSFFADQLNEAHRYDLKERTDIRQVYCESGTDRSYYDRIIGWWNVDKGWHHEDTKRNTGMEPWIIFVKKEHAKIWLQEIS